MTVFGFSLEAPEVALSALALQQTVCFGTRILYGMRFGVAPVSAGFLAAGLFFSYFKHTSLNPAVPLIGVDLAKIAWGVNIAGAVGLFFELSGTKGRALAHMLALAGLVLFAIACMVDSHFTTGGRDSGARRVSEILPDPNMMAFLMVTTTLTGIACGGFLLNISRILGRIGVGNRVLMHLSSVGLAVLTSCSAQVAFETLSRGAWFAGCIGFVVECLLLNALLSKWSERNSPLGRWAKLPTLGQGLVLAGLLSVALMVALRLDVSVIVSRLLSSFDSQNDSWSNRMVAWNFGRRMLGDFPWIGVGWDNVVQIYAAIYMPDRLIDGAALKTNTYLYIAAAVGIPVLLAFALYIYGSLARVEGNQTHPSVSTTKTNDLLTTFNEFVDVALLSVVVTFLVGFWVNGLLFCFPIGILFWYSLGACTIRRNFALPPFASESKMRRGINWLLATAMISSIVFVGMFSMQRSARVIFRDGDTGSILLSNGPRCINYLGSGEWRDVAESARSIADLGFTVRAIHLDNSMERRGTGEGLSLAPISLRPRIWIVRGAWSEWLVGKVLDDIPDDSVLVYILEESGAYRPHAFLSAVADREITPLRSKSVIMIVSSQEFDQASFDPCPVSRRAQISAFRYERIGIPRSLLNKLIAKEALRLGAAHVDLPLPVAEPAYTRPDCGGIVHLLSGIVSTILWVGFLFCGPPKRGRSLILAVPVAICVGTIAVCCAMLVITLPIIKLQRLSLCNDRVCVNEVRREFRQLLRNAPREFHAEVVAAGLLNRITIDADSSTSLIRSRTEIWQSRRASSLEINDFYIWVLRSLGFSVRRSESHGNEILLEGRWRLLKEIGPIFRPVAVAHVPKRGGQVAAQHGGDFRLRFLIHR